jgi:hypothetical protein
MQHPGPMTGCPLQFGCTPVGAFCATRVGDDRACAPASEIWAKFNRSPITIIKAAEATHKTRIRFLLGVSVA